MTDPQLTMNERARRVGKLGAKPPAPNIPAETPPDDGEGDLDDAQTNAAPELGPVETRETS